ncbi:nucleoside triphosphate pyrophosphohydrolase [Shewanella avicenniae]|uniref:Nucleoside triphosphate pyrophosphohydrolase n=1 Tax=Shewanella avicenniae TaxID=2814294 RepID=A0ABX7QTL0_9GAMM|nr:nucleoside triphosphate pyrophosphohydrolase [Shewanella avicenniae]QSX34764.1 nucleoside triphosphate pyrophosphohydrolase [Shewanella avicenniae]
MTVQQYQLDDLLRIMTQLRHPELGCPWDKQQTFASIVPFTLEEAYEVADAIANEDWQELPSELGDLLFQVVFYAELGREQQRFDFNDVVHRICHKLITRHPHVFGELADANLSEQQLKDNWEQQKAQERNARTQTSILADIPKALPSLARAVKIQKRVARVGFDWDELAPVVAKVHEEIDEVLAEVQPQQPASAALKEEVGDLLFAVANLARHLGVNPEEALHVANRKFERRFRGVEQKVAQSGKPFSDHTLQSLDQFWNEVKTTEVK